MDNSEGDFMKKFLSLLLVAGSFACGCSSMIDPETNMFGGGRVTTASANQMFDKDFESFSDEQLLRLLDPESPPKSPAKFSDLTPSEKLEYLRRAFFSANQKANKDEANGGYGRGFRSQIQDRLIAASNQRCNIYMTYLKRISTFNNAIFGTLSTVFGGAGAIVTGQAAARALSGLAGISSGTRAELNQAIFESVATSVIVPGFQQKRADLLKEMSGKRKLDVAEYTVEGAVADAINYHGACSLDAGIAYAQKSIVAYEDIGIKRFVAVQEQVGIARATLESFTAPIGAAVVATKVLDDFVKKIPEYRGKADKSQTELLAMLNSLEESAKTGALRKEAADLDQDFKDKMLAYAAATGPDKSDSLTVLDAQQSQARGFARKLDARSTEILVELKKSTK